jgi:hypothetical protein
LGLFLYFPEMLFILYSGCLCKCLFAWIKTEQFNFCSKKKKRFFCVFMCVFLFWVDPDQYSWPNYLIGIDGRIRFQNYNIGWRDFINLVRKRIRHIQMMTGHDLQAITNLKRHVM